MNDTMEEFVLVETNLLVVGKTSSTPVPVHIIKCNAQH